MVLNFVVLLPSHSNGSEWNGNTDTEDQPFNDPSNYTFQFICSTLLNVAVHKRNPHVFYTERVQIKLDHQFSPLNGKWIQFQCRVHFLFITLSFIIFIAVSVYLQCVSTMGKKARQFILDCVFKIVQSVPFLLIICFPLLFWLYWTIIITTSLSLSIILWHRTRLSGSEKNYLQSYIWDMNGLNFRCDRLFNWTNF